MPNSPSTASNPAPLLTIAIPTYNRSASLAELLAGLTAQDIDTASEVEIIIADNCSADDTEAVVSAINQAGKLHIRYHRHPENIGANPNFCFCYRAARGRYFWLLGDDDIIVPGGIEKVLQHLRSAEFDLVYLASYGFRNDWQAERAGDPFHRRFHTVRSAAAFVSLVHMMFTFISGMIVNKQRLEAIPHQQPEDFIQTHLVQLSWTLPLLRNQRRSLIVWERLIAGRQGNTGVYCLGDIFGTSLVNISRACLPDRPHLADILINISIRRWFPEFIVDHRSRPGETYDIDKEFAVLHQLHRGNFRYWLFLWPAFKLPLPLARIWVRFSVAISKLLHVIRFPGFWRKQTD